MAEAVRHLTLGPAVALVPLACLAAAGAAGLAGVLLPAFGYLPAIGHHRLSLDPIRDLLGVPGLWRSVLLGLGCGLAATALSVGATLLVLAGLAGTPAQERLRRGLAPLIAIPHAAAAFGLAFLIAPSGLLIRLVASPLGLAVPPDVLVVNDPLGLAMIAGLATKELPFLLLVSLAALPQVDAGRRLRLAGSFGYGRVAGFALAVWPSLYRQIRLPVLAVAAFSSSVVDVAIVLGPQAPPPLAVRIVQWMGDPDLSLRLRASAGALLQLGVTGAVLLAWSVLEMLASHVRRRHAEAGRRLARDRSLRLLCLVPAALAGLALVGGILALLLWSFAASWFFPDLVPSAWTTRTWSTALGAAAAPLHSTLAIGAVSAGAALVLVVAMLQFGRGEGRALSPPAVALLAMPLVVPQIAFVLGLQTAALQLGLPPALGTVAGLHLVFVLPYVAFALSGPWAALDPRFERIAAGLGACGPRIFLRIRLALMAPALASAFAIGFAVSVGQYLPTLLAGQGRISTITTEAVALGAGGNRRTAGAYALLQMLLPCMAFSLAALVRRRAAGPRP